MEEAVAFLLGDDNGAEANIIKGVDVRGRVADNKWTWKI
jgi:hypothetical protein